MHEKPEKFIHTSKLGKRVSGCALAWAMLWGPSSCNRVLIYVNSRGYQESTFIVTDAGVDTYNDFYWLIGSVNGKKERMIPPVSKKQAIDEPEDLLEIHPIASRLPVLYNPSMPKAFLQSESLRVKYKHDNFWEREAKAGSFLLKMAFVPLLLCFAFKRLELLYIFIFTSRKRFQNFVQTKIQQEIDKQQKIEDQ